LKQKPGFVIEGENPQFDGKVSIQ